MKAHTFLGSLLIGSLLFLSVGTAYCDSNQAVSHEGLDRATFAGGCFWCMEHPFDEQEGVVSTTAGYTSGQKKNSYRI